MADTDLVAAIAEFRTAMPGWWFSIGECSVSCDASIGPDRNWVPEPILSEFDEGFHADLEQPSTMAAALRHVTAQAVQAVLAFQRNRGWRDIGSVPKDGTVVELTWMSNGIPQEIWPMQWGHVQRNGLFPGKVGMWVAPDGSITWNDDSDGGPTHWRPLEERNGD